MVNFEKFNSLTSLYFNQANKLESKPHLWRKINNKYDYLTWNDTRNYINNLSFLEQNPHIKHVTEEKKLAFKRG